MSTRTPEDVQTGVPGGEPAHRKSEKFEPRVQELRTRFAHIKCELRHIQRGFRASPKRIGRHRD